MSKMFAVAVPILPDKMEQWKKFADDLKGRWSTEFKKSRKDMGIHERTFLQETPMGNFVIVTLEGDNPEQAFASFGQGNDEFTKWFMSGVSEIHGIDLTAPPAGPPPTLIIDSNN